MSLFAPLLMSLHSHWQFTLRMSTVLLVWSFGNAPACNVLPNSRLRSFRKGFEGAYVVSINGRPVFDPEDIDTKLQQIYSSSHPPDTIQIELAPEKKCDHGTSRATPVHLRMHDLCRVCALQSVAGEDMTCNKYSDALDDFASDLTYSEMSAVISEWAVCRVQSDGMTDEERSLKKFTRRNLLKNLPIGLIGMCSLMLNWIIILRLDALASLSLVQRHVVDTFFGCIGTTS